MTSSRFVLMTAAVGAVGVLSACGAGSAATAGSATSSPATTGPPATTSSSPAATSPATSPATSSVPAATPTAASAPAHATSFYAAQYLQINKVCQDSIDQLPDDLSLAPIAALKAEPLCATANARLRTAQWPSSVRSLIAAEVVANEPVLADLQSLGTHLTVVDRDFAASNAASNRTRTALGLPAL